MDIFARAEGNQKVYRGVIIRGNRLSGELDFGERSDMDIWFSMEEHLAHCLLMFLHVSRAALGETHLWTSDSHPHAENCFEAIWKCMMALETSMKRGKQIRR